MKINLLSLVVLAITIFVSCGPSEEEKTKLAYKENITALLIADAGLSTFTKHDATLQAAAMRKFDLSKYPPDFSAAYVDHIHAWEDLARVDKALMQLSSEENINELLSQEVMNEIFGTGASPILDAMELENKLNERRQIIGENILATFREVERIAVTYGATLPR